MTLERSTPRGRGTESLRGHPALNPGSRLKPAGNGVTDWLIPPSTSITRRRLTLVIRLIKALPLVSRPSAGFLGLAPGALWAIQPRADAASQTAHRFFTLHQDRKRLATTG